MSEDDRTGVSGRDVNDDGCQNEQPQRDGVTGDVAQSLCMATVDEHSKMSSHGDHENADAEEDDGRIHGHIQRNDGHCPSDALDDEVKEESPANRSPQTVNPSREPQRDGRNFQLRELDEMKADEVKEEYTANQSSSALLEVNLSPTRSRRTTSAIQYIGNVSEQSQFCDLTTSQNALRSEQETQVDQRQNQEQPQQGLYKPPPPDELAPLKRSLSRRHRSRASHYDGDAIYASSDDEMDDDARKLRRRQKRSNKASRTSPRVNEADVLVSTKRINNDVERGERGAVLVEKGTIAILPDSRNSTDRTDVTTARRVAPGLEHVVDTQQRRVRLGEYEDQDDDTNAAVVNDLTTNSPNGSFAGRSNSNNVDNTLLVSAHLVVPPSPENSTDLVVEATPADEILPAMSKGRLLVVAIVVILIVIVAILIVVVVTIRVIGGGSSSTALNIPTINQDNETNTPNIESSNAHQLATVFNPVGSTIRGARVGGRFSNSMAMSSDGQTIVVGEARLGQTFGNDVSVRVYRLQDRLRDDHQIVGLSTLDWVQIGADIVGVGNVDSFGLSVSISRNGTIVACSTPDYSDATHGQRSGLVQVYRYMEDSNKTTSSDNNGSGNWIQVGQNLVGLQQWDQFGVVVSLSDDGATLAASASQSAKSEGTGYVRVFKYNTENDTWNPMMVRNSDGGTTSTSETIFGQDDNGQFGESLSISGNGHALAVGTPNYSNSKGIVTVFNWEGTTGEWSPLLESSPPRSHNSHSNPVMLLQGELPGDFFGKSVSLSSNGKCLAVGSLGYVRVLCYTVDVESDGSWQAVGSNLVAIDGISSTASLDRGGGFGTSVSLSQDVKTADGDHENGLGIMRVAVGYPLAKGSGGEVHVYQYGDQSWIEIGGVLNGHKEGDQFGTTVSISQDGNVVSGSAPFGDGTGHVRIYQSLEAPTARPSATRSRSIRLQLIHSSDNESYLQDPNTLEKRILHYSALYSGLQTMATTEEVEGNRVPIHLMAADAILPGVFYEASSEVDAFGDSGSGEGVLAGGHNGIGEILMFNAMGNIGLGVGSTDLGGGIDEFAWYIQQAKFPILTVNLDFTNITLKNEDTPPLQFGKRDAENCLESFGKIVKSCFYDYGPNDFRLGVIATSPSALFNIVRGGKEALQGLDFVGGSDPETSLPLNPRSSILIMEQVKLLREKAGVDIIILIDRSGEGPIADPSVVKALEGVNIVVTDNAGSDFIVQVNNRHSHDGVNDDDNDAPPFNRIRDFPSETTSYVQYPIVQEDRNSQEVLLLNAHAQYSHIGNLIVEYDLLTGNLLGWDEVRSGPIATTKDNVVRMASYLNNMIGNNSSDNESGREGVTKDGRLVTEYSLYVEQVVSIFDQLASTPLITKAYSTLATTKYPLVRPRLFVFESNISRLISDAYLWYAKRQLEVTATDTDDTYVASLKNFGGIRDDIIGPNLIRLSVQSTLPFNNKLVLIRLRLDHLLAALENGFGGSALSSGKRPGLSGLIVGVDASKPALIGLPSVTEPSQVKYVAIDLNDAGIGGEEPDEDNLLVLVDNFQVTVNASLGETFVLLAAPDYLVGGGDGYSSLLPTVNEDGTNGDGGSSIVIETGVGEQQVLEEYVTIALNGVIDMEDPPLKPNIFTA